MNFDTPFKNLAARKYLDGMKIYTWYKVKELPRAISYEIIDLADKGYSEIRKIVFNETFDSIMIINKADENNLEKYKNSIEPNSSKNRNFNRGVG